MPDLTQLVYVSRRPAALSTTQIVDDIVLPSMKRNLAADVTGCLWFGAEHFLQVLEGETETVDATFERIRRDERHHDVRVVRRAPIAERAFVRYSLKHIESDEIEEVRRLVERYEPPASPDATRRHQSAGHPTDAASDELPEIVVAAIARLRSLLL